MNRRNFSCIFLATLLSLSACTESIALCMRLQVTQEHPLSFGKFAMGTSFSRVDSKGKRNADCAVSLDGRNVECSILDPRDDVEYGFNGQIVAVKELKVSSRRTLFRELTEKSKAERYLKAKFGMNCWTVVNAPYGNEIYSRRVFREKSSQKFFFLLKYNSENQLMSIEMKDGSA